MPRHSILAIVGLIVGAIWFAQIKKAYESREQELLMKSVCPDCLPYYNYSCEVNKLIQHPSSLCLED